MIIMNEYELLAVFAIRGLHYCLVKTPGGVSTMKLWEYKRLIR